MLKEAHVKKVEWGVLNFKVTFADRISLINLILTQYTYVTVQFVNIINFALHCSLIDVWLICSVHTIIVNIQTLKEQIKEIKTQSHMILDVQCMSYMYVNTVNSHDLLDLRIISINVIYIQDVLVFIFLFDIIFTIKFTC